MLLELQVGTQRHTVLLLEILILISKLTILIILMKKHMLLKDYIKENYKIDKGKIKASRNLNKTLQDKVEKLYSDQSGTFKLND